MPSTLNTKKVMLEKDTCSKPGESNELLIKVRPKGNNELHHVFIVHLQPFIMKAWEISPPQMLFSLRHVQHINSVICN